MMITLVGIVTTYTTVKFVIQRSKVMSRKHNNDIVSLKFMPFK